MLRMVSGLVSGVLLLFVLGPHPARTASASQALYGTHDYVFLTETGNGADMSSGGVGNLEGWYAMGPPAYLAGHFPSSSVHSLFQPDYVDMGSAAVDVHLQRP